MSRVPIKTPAFDYYQSDQQTGDLMFQLTGSDIIMYAPFSPPATFKDKDNLVIFESGGKVTLMRGFCWQQNPTGPFNPENMGPSGFFQGIVRLIIDHPQLEPTCGRENYAWFIVMLEDNGASALDISIAKNYLKDYPWPYDRRTLVHCPQT